MIVIPAIDLLGGRCVRLKKGDYGSSEKVAEDAVTAASEFIGCGAELLHTVDLDGARSGAQTNFDIIRQLCGLGIRVQTGGGLRDMKALERCFSAGVYRCVIGSAAVREPNFLAGAVREFGARIAAGVDCADGVARV